MKYFTSTTQSVTEYSDWIPTLGAQFSSNDCVFNSNGSKVVSKLSFPAGIYIIEADIKTLTSGQLIVQSGDGNFTTTGIKWITVNLATESNIIISADGISSPITVDRFSVFATTGLNTVDPEKIKVSGSGNPQSNNTYIMVNGFPNASWSTTGVLEDGAEVIKYVTDKWLMGTYFGGNIAPTFNCNDCANTLAPLSVNGTWSNDESSVIPLPTVESISYERGNSLVNTENFTVTVIPGQPGGEDATLIDMLEANRCRDLSMRDVYMISFDVGIGQVNPSITGAINPVWTLPNGSKIKNSSINITTTENGRIRLTFDNDNTNNIEFIDNGTDERMLADLKDFSDLSYYLNLYNCPNVTGDLSSVSGIIYLLSLYNCPVTGDLSSVSGVSYHLNLSNCPVTGDLSSLICISYYLNLSGCLNVTGDLSSLSCISYYLNLSSCLNVTGDLSSLSGISYYLRLSNCSNVTGILSPTATISFIYLNNTGLSINDVDQSVINLDAVTTVSGTLDLSGLQRSSASSAAVSSLISKGWTVVDATVV